MKSLRISDVRAFVLEKTDSGRDYNAQDKGHWIVDSLIANPMSAYPKYKQSRASFGKNFMDNIIVEVEASNGTVGLSLGQGGVPVCYMIEKHFKRFLVGQDPRQLNQFWDQMYRASLFYGSKGLPLWAISAVDLALWDLLGILRQEPVYQMIGGATRDEIELYCTGIRPDLAKEAGFVGGKMPLPHGVSDRKDGLNNNVEIFRQMRELVGPNFYLMADCWMALDVPYAVELAYAMREVDLYWLEEVLPPEDFDGLKLLKERAPFMRWTTGEHEYTRYGFRKLIETRSIDILQPDIRWCGGLTELLRISAMAAAYDISVVPHASSAYIYHFVITQPHSPFCEYLNSSPDCTTFPPVFGEIFTDEPVPLNGRIRPSDSPGWGLTLDRENLKLVRFFPG